MNSTELKNRTKKFAVNTIKFTESIKPTYSNVIIIKQVIRAATSVGANYRSSLRGKSNPDFINKINKSIQNCSSLNKPKSSNPSFFC